MYLIDKETYLVNSGNLSLKTKRIQTKRNKKNSKSCDKISDKTNSPWRSWTNNNRLTELKWTAEIKSQKELIIKAPEKSTCYSLLARIRKEITCLNRTLINYSPNDAYEKKVINIHHRTVAGVSEKGDSIYLFP